MAERLDQAAKTGCEIDARFCGWSSPTRTKNWSLSPVLLPNSIHKTTISSMGHIWLVLTIVEALYGGLHLLAWNASFSTDVERSLWHLSAIAVVCLGPSCTILVDRYKPSLYHRYPVWGLGWLLETAFLVCHASLHLLARVYLVVECFIELAYLPDSAFTTPNFTLYIPHFG